MFSFIFNNMYNPYIYLLIRESKFVFHILCPDFLKLHKPIINVNAQKQFINLDIILLYLIVFIIIQYNLYIFVFVQ